MINDSPAVLDAVSPIYGAQSAVNTAPTASDAAHAEIQFQILKQSIHQELVGSLDLASAEGLTPSQFQQQLKPFVSRSINERSDDVTPAQRARLETELYEEMFGIGPLEKLMRDPTVNDILVNHAHEVFIERAGQLELTDVVFADANHLLQIIQRIASSVGRRVDEVSPMVDARLPDGSRVNAVIPPLALDGPKLSIRRFGKVHLTLDRLVENSTMTQPIADFLKAAVEARISVLISGGTGAGKTTLLNALSSCICDDERIVTIEDSAELILQHRHVARLETRPANSEGVGEFTQRDLVRNSLRMRPDRIIVGEVRGVEAFDMLQAMNTGHEGSLTTIHANDAHDALMRLEMMVAMAGLELPHDVVRSYIGSGIGVVVQISRLKGGARRVMRVAELNPLGEGSKQSYQLSDVFKYERTGVDSAGEVQGAVATSSETPKCLRRFDELGIDYDASVFSDSIRDRKES
jgi:pilus assembly protein CpaF